MKLTPLFLTSFAAGLLLACSEINSSWEEVGGGYLKYSVNGASQKTIGLDPDDVRTPSYWNHYFSLETNEDSSKIGDRIAFLVADPKLGKNHVVEEYSWFVQEYGVKLRAVQSLSTVTLDQKDDSTWTGFLDLYFTKDPDGKFDSTMQTINVTGRFRYWPDPDD